MFVRSLLATLLLLVPLCGAAGPAPAPAQAASAAAAPSIPLPKPDLAGQVTLEKALGSRRSVRAYAPGPLTLAEVSQLLWAAHGITGPGGKRTTPSARAVYPLEVRIAAHDVTGLAPGIYRYLPGEHALAPVALGDPRASVTAAASGQASVEQAPLVIAVAGDSVLAAEKFRARAARWLGMEAGFVVQDVYLEATALGLGTVMVGGFEDAAARRALALPAGWEALALMPVGRTR